MSSSGSLKLVGLNHQSGLGDAALSDSIRAIDQTRETMRTKVLRARMAAVGSIPSKNADASRIKFCATQNRTVMMMISINGLAGASLFSLSGTKWQLGDQCHQKCYLYFFQSHRVPASILHTAESQRQIVN